MFSASGHWGTDPRTGQRDETLPTTFDNIVISVDCAFKTVATADYTAILVVAASRRKRFILDVINEHLDVAAMEVEIRRLRNKYCPITAVLVEGAANGLR
jgi:phage terminase large subunit-like protein